MQVLVAKGLPTQWRRRFPLEMSIRSLSNSLLILACSACGLRVLARCRDFRASGQVRKSGPSGRVLEQVGFDQKLDAQLPMALSFQDETGKTIRLGDLFRIVRSCCRWSTTIAPCSALRF